MPDTNYFKLLSTNDAGCFFFLGRIPAGAVGPVRAAAPGPDPQHQHVPVREGRPHRAQLPGPAPRGPRVQGLHNQVLVPLNQNLLLEYSKIRGVN